MLRAPYPSLSWYHRFTPSTYASMLTCVFFSVPPSISPFSFGNLPLNAGVIAQLQCIVAYGDLPISTSWVYPDSDHVTTLKVADRVSLLTINELSAKHSGNYTCIASNAAGRTAFMTPLVINGLSRQWGVDCTNLSLSVCLSVSASC